MCLKVVLVEGIDLLRIFFFQRSNFSAFLVQKWQSHLNLKLGAFHIDRFGLDPILHLVKTGGAVLEVMGFFVGW